MTKQLRLNQVVGNGSHIQGNKCRVAARAVFMQRVGNQLFAGAGLAINQHGDIGIGETANGAKHFLHGWGFANNFLSWRNFLRHFLGFLLPGKGHTTAGHINQFIQIKGLRQIFKGTALIGGHSTVEIRVGGGNNHWDIRARGMNLLEQFKTIYAGHADIGNNNFWQGGPQGYQQVIAIFKTAHFNAFARNGFFHNPAQ